MDCLSPKFIYPHRTEEWLERYEEKAVTVPCGKCLVCLQKERAMWTFRLEQEFKYSHGALFITLTYDEKHLRSDCNLKKRDVQLFIKRLRKRAGRGLRYFCVGEYGSKFGRPHYHLLLFNCGDVDLVRASWNDSKGCSIGMVHVGRVTSASIAYCTKYIIQKADAPVDRERPFRLMSRAYGIGARYLSDAVVSWHRKGLHNYAMVYERKVALPRFFKTKIWYDMHEKHCLSEKSAVAAVKQRELQEGFYKSKFGENWQRVMDEERDFVLARVKSKVAYTQRM